MANVSSCRQADEIDVIRSKTREKCEACQTLSKPGMVTVELFGGTPLSRLMPHGLSD